MEEYGFEVNMKQHTEGVQESANAVIQEIVLILIGYSAFIIGTSYMLVRFFKELGLVIALVVFVVSAFRLVPYLFNRAETVQRLRYT